MGVTFFSLLFYCCQLCGYFFVDQGGNYSILLPNEMELAKIDTLREGEINNVFYGIDTIHQLEYTLSLSVTQSKNGDIEGPEMISKYEEECNCKVESVQRVSFKHFNGVKYQIKKNNEDISLGGEVYVSEGNNDKSINIVSISLLKDSVKLSDVLEPILNTLVLNF